MTRKYTQDQITGYPWFTPLYIDGDFTVAAFTVEINDPLNPAGYVQVGLCEVSSALDFPLGLAFGAEVASIPTRVKRGTELDAIAGTVPSALSRPPDCPFAPRCTRAMPQCDTDAGGTAARVRADLPVHRA